MDVVNFGIDVRRLKEFGEVSMSKGVDRIRKHLPGLWERLTPLQRAAFHMSYLLENLETLSGNIEDLEKQIGNLQEVRDAITLIYVTLFASFPKDVVHMLREALGKWKVEAHGRIQ